MIKFTEEGHKYESLPDQPQINWLGVTTLVHAFCKPFDADEQAPKSSRKRNSKWYGLPVEEIKAAWVAENTRSINLGKWYHPLRENEYLKQENAVQPDIRDGVKYAPAQVLKPGMLYPEHLVYLESAGICGQADKVEVTTDGVLNINDYKTCKEIRRKGFSNWETGTEKLLAPLSHLDKCEYNLYALQMSIYAYIILRHSPALTLGKLTIEHILFEEEGRDKYDYPIYRQMENGDYVVKDIVMIEVPYMKNEVMKLIEYVKKNRHKIVKH